jgi:hypothetical protein
MGTRRFALGVVGLALAAGCGSTEQKPAPQPPQAKPAAKPAGADCTCKADMGDCMCDHCLKKAATCDCSR